MSNSKTVWVDGVGDLRKQKDEPGSKNSPVTNVELLVRRLTSGKGRTVVEITGLPSNKAWCKDLAKKLKQKLGVGGTYKNNAIEVHGEKLNEVTELLDRDNLKWKKIGG